ncbi:Matrix metalloproteinase-16 [Trichinella zimbabwensis]|uniref:Matrix metalloproteinase-16 n=1 Tax=Trichinella zimbabwensis TaxID=268475 RepID=A0A0V1HWH9_9BILA|nr:Matrix metalloproteinase-16 [Trichinella zimbabwensis]
MKFIIEISFNWIFTFILFISLPTVVNSMPILSTSTKINPDATTNALSYLIEFGYLPRGNPEISNLRTEDAVKTALGRLQEFAGLEPTGNLDEATLKLMNTKRCGLADFSQEMSSPNRNRRFALQGLKWDRLNLTYKVANYTPFIGPGRTRRSIYDALSVWSEVSALKFTETQDDYADLVVEFHSGEHGDGYPFDGPNIVLAHAFFPGALRGGDVHFDNDERWSDIPQQDVINLFAVAAHEFGHSLGLGHSRDRSALMFPYYSGFDPNFKLSHDDITAIQKLYGSGKYETSSIPEVTEEPTKFDDNESENDDQPFDHPVTEIPNEVPDPCNSDIDALSNIRNEIFIFKNKYFWRLDDHGYLVENPILLDRFWYGFHENVSHIDAVYERPGLDRIVFFFGRQYWEFSANIALPNYPRNLTSLGLPEDVEKIDAAFVWDYNGKTYFFSGEQYWRFDEATGLVEHDYPRNIKIWEGIPKDVDGAFTDKSGVTHFFKNHRVYRFNSFFMRVEIGYPIKISSFWNHCNNPNQNMLPMTANSAPEHFASHLYLWIICNAFMCAAMSYHLGFQAKSLLLPF